jgi:hypothetical protein
MKKSHKSDKIQAIIDEWLVNYIGINLLEGKNLKMAQTLCFIS